MAVSGEGVTSPPPGTSAYAALTSIPISAVTSPGYVFASWAWTGRGSPIYDPYTASTTLVMDASRTVTANFRPQQEPPQAFLLTMAVNGRGSTNPPPGASAWNAGLSLPILAAATRGYVFARSLSE